MFVPGLPDTLDGFRVLHLSDLHLGTLSLGGRALDRAVDWGNSRTPDLVAITGDLVTRRGGKRKLEEAFGRLRSAPTARSPFSEITTSTTRATPSGAPPTSRIFGRAGAEILRDDERTFDVDGARVQVVGVHPGTYQTHDSRPAERADEGVPLRILLCHFPDVVRMLPPGAFHLVLAGHFHGGQICLPSPWGRLRLKDLRANYWEGLFDTPAGALHVSRGLGTSFVPFRLLARPEATLLVLRPA